MSDTKKLSKECIKASDALEKLALKFAALQWAGHDSYIQGMASHLRIYAHQLEAKEVQA